MEERQYQIEVKDTGARFACGENEYILAAMQRARCVPIHYGCFGGGCGVCKRKVVDGAVHAVKRMSREHVTPEEERQGVALICCIQPRGDVVLARVSE